MTLEERAREWVARQCDRNLEILPSVETVASITALLQAVRDEALEECHDIALAIDSKRGNERVIAEAIRALKGTP